MRSSREFGDLRRSAELGNLRLILRLRGVGPNLASMFQVVDHSRRTEVRFAHSVCCAIPREVSVAHWVGCPMMTSAAVSQDDEVTTFT
jgi:hypothetical protein